MTIELNEVTLPGSEQALSLLADEGQLTCITGGSGERRTRCLYMLMGFEAPSGGCVSVDGEPLAGGCINHLRKHIAFVPSSLDTVGQLVPYEPPTIQDVLALRSNRGLAISEADVEEECRRAAGIANPLQQPASGRQDSLRRQKVLLLAVAVLRRKPVLLVDSPLASTATYLQQQARQEGRTVIVATDDAAVVRLADNVVSLV